MGTPALTAMRSLQRKRARPRMASARLQAAKQRGDRPDVGPCLVLPLGGRNREHQVAAGIPQALDVAGITQATLEMGELLVSATSQAGQHGSAYFGQTDFNRRLVDVFVVGQPTEKTVSQTGFCRSHGCTVSAVNIVGKPNKPLRLKKTTTNSYACATNVKLCLNIFASQTSTREGHR